MSSASANNDEYCALIIEEHLNLQQEINELLDHGVVAGMVGEYSGDIDAAVESEVAVSIADQKMRELAELEAELDKECA